MADVKISQLPAATTPVVGTEVLPIVQSGTTSQVSIDNLTVGRAVSMSSATVSTGNLNFSSTAQRITGDFSNATIANRVAFQSSTTNGNTQITVFPNGTATNAALDLYSNSDPTNTSRGLIRIDTAGVDFKIDSTRTGTGTYLPITFYTSGSEKVRIDTSGNVGIGTNLPTMKLDVNGITSWQGGTTGQTAQIVGASSGINGGGNFKVLSNTTQAVDVGGALTLGGYYTSITASVDFGVILGAKENSTGGNTAGYLAFGTRVNAGNMTERMRIDSSGNVGIGATANASAILDAQSTTKGVRMPNMTTTQKNAIASPAAGLMVFDTTLAKLCVYSGSAWQTITSV